MEFYMKLPRNKKEFVLFMAVISVISVNIIAPLITFFEAGFHMYIWTDIIKVIPLIWVTVIALVLITYKPAEWLTSLVVKEGDSFGPHIVINISIQVQWHSQKLHSFYALCKSGARVNYYSCPIFYNYHMDIFAVYYLVL